jgi:hypothetical protein
MTYAYKHNVICVILIFYLNRITFQINLKNQSIDSITDLINLLSQLEN